MLVITAYIGALLVGVSLGLIGGGGSILTVPILVYLLGINPVLSTAYSLFIVGCSALVGAVNKYRKGLVNLKTAGIFAIPSFIAVYLTRLYLVPAIPAVVFQINGFQLTKDIAIMVFFAFVMLMVAVSMISDKKKEKTNGAPLGAITYNYPMIMLEGFGIGILTGIVGAGGGFLIIPALVLLAKLPMKLAVGTSLTIIALKSLIGFIGDIQGGISIDWLLLLTFTSLAVVGIFIGSHLSNFISGSKLKRGFGWFVFAMAVLMLIQELVFNIN